MDMVSGLVPAPWSPLAMVTGTIPLWCTTDSMSLAYEGNRLVSVSDEGRQLLGADLFGFSDGADALVEYEYDENGNTVKDLNRKISSIQYNSLNLRQRREDRLHHSKEQALCLRFAFNNYDTNIIVGPLGTIKYVSSNANGSVSVPNRKTGAVIFNSHGDQLVSLTRRAIQRILK